MIKEAIHIENLKCMGCGTTITDRINQLDGVGVDSIDLDGSTVHVNYSDIHERKEIVRLLKKLGYPEKGESNPLMTQAKSYASCALGRMKN